MNPLASCNRVVVTASYHVKGVEGNVGNINPTITRGPARTAVGLLFSNPRRSNMAQETKIVASEIMHQKTAL